MAKKKYTPIISLLDAAQRRRGSEKVTVELMGYSATTTNPEVVQVKLEFMLYGPGCYTFMKELTTGIKSELEKREVAQ